MKAIILSAGQGKRLFPYTETTPKCLLDIMPGTTLLGWQMAQLAAAGIEDIVVVTGFCADRVEQEVRRSHGFCRARTLFNPDFASSDNLRSLWMARGEMTGDFLLLNGDTLFTSGVVETLLGAPRRPIAVTCARKDRYDADDMKVLLDADGRLQRIGKSLDPELTDAESIGMLLFRGKGVAIFRDAVDRAARAADGDRVWYLSVIDRLAAHHRVDTVEIASGDWCEVDFPVDLQRARQAAAYWCERDLPATAAVAS